MEDKSPKRGRKPISSTPTIKSIRMEDKSPKRGRKHFSGHFWLEKREWKISPRRGDGNGISGTANLCGISEWKISPRRGDGNRWWFLYVLFGIEWKISPRRGDGIILLIHPFFIVVVECKIAPRLGDEYTKSKHKRI